jgi:hypothetical protein
LPVHSTERSVGAGKNDRQQGDLVDDLDYGAEPGLAQRGIEPRTQREIDLCVPKASSALIS